VEINRYNAQLEPLDIFDLRVYFFLSFLLIFISSYSQTLDWLNYEQTEQRVTSIQIQSSNTGNLFRLSHVSNQQEIFQYSKIDKIGSNGQVFSLITSQVKYWSFDIDSNNRIFLLGSITGGADVDPSPNGIVNVNVSTTQNPPPYNLNTALVVVILDEQLNYHSHRLWDTYLQGSPSFLFPQDIKLDNDNNVLISFYSFAGSAIDCDFGSNQNILNNFKNVVFKYSSDFNTFFWYKKLTSSFDPSSQFYYPKTISFDFDENGNTYFAVRVADSLIVESYNVDGVNRFPNQILKLNGFQREYIDDIKVISPNKIIMGGHFLNNININPKVNEPPLIIQSDYDYIPSPVAPAFAAIEYSWADAFIVVYDSLFNIQWHRNISHTGNDVIDDIDFANNLVFVTSLCSKDNSGIYQNEFPALVNNSYSSNWSQLQVFDTLGNLLRYNQDIAPEGGWGLDTNPNSVIPSNLDYSYGRKSIVAKNNEFFVLSTFVSGVPFVPFYSPNFNWGPPCNGIQYISASNSRYSVLAKYSLNFPTSLSTPEISQGDTVQYCPGASIIISRVIDPSLTCDYKYTWTKDSSTGQVVSNSPSYQFQPQSNGYYFLKVSSPNGMTSICDSIYVQQANTNLNITVSPLILLAPPYQVSIDNNTQDISSYNFVWNMGIGSSFTNNNSNFDYTYPIGQNNYQISVTATNTNNCQLTQTWTVSTFSGSGIDEFENHLITVYPNPFNEEFYLDTDIILNNLNLTLYDVFGRETAFEMTDNLIRMINVKPGVYFLVLKREDFKSSWVRLVKN
jgi:hypothetical protein